MSQTRHPSQLTPVIPIVVIFMRHVKGRTVAPVLDAIVRQYNDATFALDIMTFAVG